ncbi:MAG: hypothetical protein AB1384_10080 [Actinomycetota bacterium]
MTKMGEWERCPECGVPAYFTREHSWLDNGDIVHSRDKERRLVFIESENIDPLFIGIEELIGVSIERIVIACVQENDRMRFGLFIPHETRERIRSRETDYRPVLDTFLVISRDMGRGKLEVVDLRYQGDADDFCTFRISEPFSLPLTCGSRAASIEAILGYAHDVTYEQVSPKVYDITITPARDCEGQQDRMFRDDYQHRGGGVELERCPSCGGPRALAAFKWHQDRGVIVDASTQRRMVMTTPFELDPVFQELEEELGETIPGMVVESQRRYTRENFHARWNIMDEDDFRAQFALRGLGNVKEVKARKNGLGMRLDNAVLHLIVVGYMQGAFEAATGTTSRMEWELSGGGRLELEVRPAGS